MIIPKQFQLVGKTIDVEYRPDLLKDEDKVGMAAYRRNRIYLQPSVSGYERDEADIEQSFLHEVVHWILMVMGEDKTEKYVDLFASLLHQALATATGELDANT